MIAICDMKREKPSICQDSGSCLFLARAGTGHVWTVLLSLSSATFYDLNIFRTLLAPSTSRLSRN
jgi:hypothetical protein